MLRVATNPLAVVHGVDAVASIRRLLALLWNKRTTSGAQTVNKSGCVACSGSGMAIQNPFSPGEKRHHPA